MKITRIVNGQEMEFELTDSELRAALVNMLFSPEKGGVLAEEAGELFSEALFNMDEEMACAVSPSEYTTTELVGTRIAERLQDTLAGHACRSRAGVRRPLQGYCRMGRAARRSDNSGEHQGGSTAVCRRGKPVYHAAWEDCTGAELERRRLFRGFVFCDRAGKPVDGTPGDYRHEAGRITRMKQRDMTALH